MYSPEHEKFPRGKGKTDQRNCLYLKLIFDYPPSQCEKSFELAGQNYVKAYNELEQDHGTPGVRLKKRASPFVETRDQRLVRAHELVDCWNRQRQQDDVPDREFWDKYWGDSYYGFRNAQMEMGELRDQIIRGEFKECTSERSLDDLKNELNQMLLASVREWYLKWGELDLHRLTAKDAVEIIQRMLRQVPWKEMRIVAGQQPHESHDHRSEGVLYDLIHRIFDREHAAQLMIDSIPDQDIRVQNCRQYVHENEVEATFYSKGAAVLLKKKKKKHGQL